ncbi:uncharacterized protein PAE49_014524 [Odontesthes bonariensis]|uniref:uncharacterized protein LOC142397290 n=1 Tax=Odontesthes bonariensis TaxID=219752 RepID=UPI003F581D09
MEAVFGLLLMLLGVSHGVETYCDGRQDGAQCYGALGGAVVLQLMDDASEIPRYEWRKGASVILSGRKNNIVTNTIKIRSTFIPSNGTLKINNLSRTDSGEYTLRLFNLNGRETGERTLKLSVEAPVSSVQLVSECLSQGQIWVSCSFEAVDSPKYMWTLDGHTLTDTELLSGSNETNIITLKQHVSGRLVCSVRNHISSVSKELMISVCRDHSLLTCGLLSVAAVVSFVGIGVYFKWKKIKYEKAEESAAPRRTEKSEDSSVTELRSLSD